MPAAVTMDTKCLLTISLFCFCLSACYASPDALDEGGDSVVVVDCDLDHDRTNPQLDECFRLGKDFIHQYVKAMKKGRQYKDKCSAYKTFRNCMEPMMRTCPLIKTIYHRHWHPIMDAMDCVCIHDEETCSSEQKCVEDEMDSVMAHRCDDYYLFNNEQNSPQNSCHFLHEHIWCRQNLVSSACGTNAGLFAFHVMKLFHEKKLRREKCELRKDHGFKLFSYGDGCPRNIVQFINNCSRVHLTTQTVLTFREENLVVASSSRPRKINRACDAYDAFRRCVRPIRKSCPHGVRLIYDSEGPIRTYMYKMQYVCSNETVKKNYMENLKCYIPALDSGIEDLCKDRWADLGPYLQNITAYHFYCQQDHDLTRNVIAGLDKLKFCYHTIYTEKCGDQAAGMLSDLIEQVLTDPYVLRLGYKPDCRLHDPALSPTPATPTLKSISTSESILKSTLNDKLRKELLTTRKPKVSSSTGNAASHMTSSYLTLVAMVILLLPK
ncbi:hypothetical protein CAPTEDRAFT_222507 [Capitella teleta]|uniref:Uncharacterized protein n=1 Tax=Capitella teleta TaxID=283909 RepID=R7UX68_CAPTE|nr:hypothetical protein CAPTEDRAFT_222507 [Capitella teleta]|eukprot:ELU10939.1 hypothetical protein CAPTEDRAFT_222507 [Capitella teleta]